MFNNEAGKPMRAPDSNARPTFTVPALACDCHFHVFEPGFASIPKPHYDFPQGCALANYAAVRDRLGLQRMAVVAPTYYGNDTSVTVDFLAKVGDWGRGVVFVADDVRHEELVALDKAGVRAIRLELFARQTWSLADVIAYVKHMMDLARTVGWHVQLFTPGKVLRDLLPFLASVEDTFVLDHMGYMVEADGLTVDDFAGLLKLHAQGNCWIKLSGANRLARGAPLAVVAPMARALVDNRPDRLLWGSDWPHMPDGTTDTGGLFNLLADWTPDEATRHLVLVDGPQQLFFAR